MIPNLTDGIHDGTGAQGDTWLQQHIDGYAQWAKTHNSLLVLTWDGVLRTIEDAYGLTYAGSSATATPITDAWIG